MNWKEPVIRRWNKLSGLTTFNSLTGEITVDVPEGNSLHSRFVLRHELLHVKYDKPKQSRLSLYFRTAQQRSSVAHHGVSDAFVHLIYWPKEYKAESVESKEAVKLALINLGYLADSGAMNNIAPLEVLRSMATLAAVGTTEDQFVASMFLSAIFKDEPKKVLQYFFVLRLVKIGQRELAELLFENLLSSESKQADIVSEMG